MPVEHLKSWLICGLFKNNAAESRSLEQDILHFDGQLPDVYL